MSRPVTGQGDQRLPPLLMERGRTPVHTQNVTTIHFSSPHFPIPSLTFANPPTSRQQPTAIWIKFRGGRWVRVALYMRWIHNPEAIWKRSSSTSNKPRICASRRVSRVAGGEDERTSCGPAKCLPSRIRMATTTKTNPRKVQDAVRPIWID